MYGKLENGTLIEAPINLELEDGTIIENFNKSIKLMTQYGFKPVIESKPVYNVRTQYCNLIDYSETGDTIRFNWEVVEIEFSKEEIKNQETQKAMEMLNIDLQAQAQSLSDEQALSVLSIFPVWESGVAYEISYRVRYNDILYKVITAHTSQIDYTPDIAIDLFSEVLVESEEEIPEWVRPDWLNPYMTGDKVMFEGSIYESLIDNNIWSPKEHPAVWELID